MGLGVAIEPAGGAGGRPREEDQAEDPMEEHPSITPPLDDRHGVWRSARTYRSPGALSPHR